MTNSVVRYLTPASLAATMLAMRSGRKEIFIIVEGGDDIALLSQILGLARSNFVDCRGKQNLMGLFSLVPVRGADQGTIFIRDRDHDGIGHSVKNDVSLLVTDLYDFEMQLLDGRLFGRIMAEFLRGSGGHTTIRDAFDRIIRAAGWLGALRRYAHEEDLALDFEGVSLTFIDSSTLDVDVPEMIRKIFARSSLSGDIPAVTARLKDIVESVGRLSEIASGKDVLAILSRALSRYYKCCSAKECSPEVLGRTLRISATLEDVKGMTLYQHLKNLVHANPFTWAGVVL